jgi:hypothetical protein
LKSSPKISSIDGQDPAARARISDGELAYYEEVIAVTLDAIEYLKLAIVWARADELDNLLNVGRGLVFIRDRTVAEMDRRKRDARRNGKQTG